MASNEWLRLVSGLAVSAWDAVRATWKVMTWRDVLLLILVGVWGVRRKVRRVASRLHEVREQMDDMNELNRRFLRRRDEKVDRIERILSV